MTRRTASTRSHSFEMVRRRQMKPSSPGPDAPNYNTNASRKFSITSGCTIGTEASRGGVKCYALIPCALLLFVNLLLAVYVGAALVTAARLKWDPTTYIVAREAFPKEYKLVVKWLPAAAAALLGLTFFVVIAIFVLLPIPRRVLLIFYALVMLGALVAEVVMVQRAEEELRAHLANSRAHVQEVLGHTRTVLNTLSTWHSFANKYLNLLQEAEKKSPLNLEMLKWAAIGLLGLQAAAVVLALLSALLHPWPRDPPDADRYDDEDDDEF